MFTAVSSLEQSLTEALFAATTLWYPGGDPAKIILIKEPFTPDPDLTVGDLTFADFDGSLAKSLEAAGQPNFSLDPTTGFYLGTLQTGAGGFYWEVTGVTNLPQTIYGFALVSDDATQLLASALVDTPVPLSAVDQSVSLGALRFTIRPGFME